MDLFAISGSLWRHKRATIPVVLLTMLGMFYVMAVMPPTWEAKADILLANPPGPPTSAQIAADPSLAHVNTYNPFVSLDNLVQVADVLVEMAGSPAAKQALLEAGANPQYQVAVDTSLETPPAIEVTGVAPNAQGAIHSAQLVANYISQNLYQMQAQRNVNSHYMISSIEYVKSTSATTALSGKLRTLIEVIALGLILLLVAVSVSQTLDQRKNRKHRRGRSPASVPEEYYDPASRLIARTDNQRQHAAMHMSGSRSASPALGPQTQRARSNIFEESWL
jgi:Chain length determinant protein